MARNKQAATYYDLGGVEVTDETDRAICIQRGSREVWMPKSVCRFYEITEGPFAGCKNLEIPTWLAARERLMY